MARPKKSDQKAAPPTPVAAAVAPPVLLPQAPAPALPQVLPDNSGATLVINKADYARLRDSVHSRLSTIQELLRDFAADYLRQSNLLLGEPTSLDAIPSLGALARLDGAALGFAPPLAEAALPVEEKKERKKRQHDPNAPKRPLTPYFLYMQTARPIIANDLGQDAPKGAVQEEGQRRWAAMTPLEKNAWNNAYQFNLRLYNARVHSYKAGNLAARDMSDQDALTYADANQVAQPALTGIEEAAAAGVNDQDAIVEQLQNSVPVVAAAPEEAKTPKPKQTRKRKSTAADGIEEGETSAVKNAAVTPASPEKKRKRQSKAAEPASEEPKKSGRKKKNA
ncbi:hypothetical protein BKA67DRAFT_555059 [Truncatella angustata]|uniref:HMG box domain-containing protein n=1 Tax=Truncatella angustata TaxID=152316 RepID=A0A9P8UQX8_9PEZI|nr:uncharacterized protein BKA67DRAFT_555059 [Truncatella angustata]KAH6657355.1 hypothetical protein BKA67DRAFT_555059 [Truncatella angustata]KAH8202805.1 hypothetical protein TruAng_003076 [Truncatella angustata]